MNEAKCYGMLREVRWKYGVKCPHCESDAIIKNDHDEVHVHRQRYYCQTCERNFDDLSDTVFSGRNKSLKVWAVALYLMGLNLSNAQLAKELDVSQPTAQRMVRVLCVGIVKKSLIYNLQMKLRQTKYT